MNISFQTQHLKMLGKKLLFLWIHVARAIFVLLFFVALGVGIFVWYDNVYRGEWSDEEKRRYAETAFQETVFKEHSFLSALEYVKKQETLHTKPIFVDRDIFAPLPGFEKK